jgi:asparagine synthase (glutamine-hydrolysing)
MCGIIGAINVNGEGLAERLSLAHSMLSHRGPDGDGVKYFEYDGKNIFLGHSRLSIIDLSELGHQPMSSFDSRCWITFNGEIYNYKELKVELIALGYSFVSDTDTEVLIYSWAEWGEDCLRKFIGMFAFVLYDSVNHKVFCVRDAFGIKPFYYSESKNQFYFASEIPALHILVDQELTISQSTTFNYLLKSSSDAGEDTMIEEIKALKPGSLLTITLEGDLKIEFKRWWWPSLEEDKNITFKEATEKVRELFLNSVRLHMRSDVRIGATLSGGIDSSAVVCAMRYLEPDLPIHTFSYIASASDINEESWVDLVNNHINAIPHKLELNSEDLVNDIDDLVKTQGAPFSTTSIYAQYRIFKLAKDSDVKVTLEGQGADELLAGYFGYPEWAAMSYVDKGEFLKLYRFLKSWSRLHGQPIRPILLYIKESIITNVFKSKLILGLRRVYRFIRPKPSNVEPTSIQQTFPKWIIVKDSKVEDDLMKAPMSRLEEVTPGRRLVSELRRNLMGEFDVGINGLLRYSDRNAMRFSIESRVPFLTIEMAEFLLSLPESYLISKDGVTKHVFREAMRGIVPDKVLDRVDKIGFATPDLAWTSLLDYNKITKQLDNLDFIDQEKLMDEVRGILEGKQSFSWLAWRVINFSYWYKNFKN